MTATFPGITPHITDRRPTETSQSPQLEVIVLTGGNPVRFGRMISAMVNNTPMALFEVMVGERVAYPVPSVVTARGPVALRFRARNVQRTMNGLDVEEVLGIVSSMARILEVRTPD